MNIVEASYKVGLGLKESKEGRELLSLYKNAKESVPGQTWRNFEKVGQQKWGKHYLSYPYGLEIFQANKKRNNLPPPLKEDIEKVLSSSCITLLCNECKIIGKNLEEVVKGIFRPILPQEFNGIETSPKLIRALQDLSLSCQKTGLLKLFFQNFRSKHVQEKMKEFENKKNQINSTPFNHQIRKMIRTIASQEVPIELIYKMEAFSVILDIIKQVIYESHFDLILNLNKENIIVLRERERNKLDVFSMRLSDHMLDVINWNGSIIKFDIDNRTKFDFGKKKTITLDERFTNKNYY